MEMQLDDELNKGIGTITKGNLDEGEPDMEMIEKYLKGEISVPMDDTNEKLIEQEIDYFDQGDDNE